MSKAIILQDLTLGYEGHPAIHHLTGSFAQGSLTAIVGPNGSGKSTLLKAVAGLLRPMHGHMALPAGDLAYLPQQQSLDAAFPATVQDLVSLGLWRKRGWFKALQAADQLAVEDALSRVGLRGFAGRTLEGLSGGQLQRALFARLCLQDSPVILLDEPFTAIDDRTVADMMELIRHWHQSGRTIIAVLHDMQQVRDSFPQTLILAREKIAWGNTPTVLTPENLHKAEAMQEAWDENAPWCEGRAA